MLKYKVKNGIIFHGGQSFTVMGADIKKGISVYFITGKEDDMKETTLSEIKDIITNKQKELNQLLSDDQVDKKKALEMSVELDKLINKYYCLASK